MTKRINGPSYFISSSVFFCNKLIIKRRKNLAFTLLELMVCTALIAIIFMIINKFTSTTSSYSSNILLNNVTVHGYEFFYKDHYAYIFFHNSQPFYP